MLTRKVMRLIYLKILVHIKLIVFINQMFGYVKKVILMVLQYKVK